MSTKKHNWIRTGIHIPAYLVPLWRKIENKSDFIRRAILAYAFTKFITLQLPSSVYEDISTLAHQKNMTVEDYITEHICIDLHGHAIRCPKCKKPLLLEYEIIEDAAIINCPFCLHEWEHHS